MTTEIKAIADKKINFVKETVAHKKYGYTNMAIPSNEHINSIEVKAEVAELAGNTIIKIEAEGVEEFVAITASGKVIEMKREQIPANQMAMLKFESYN